MENYIELKVDIRRHNNVVTCEIIQMDERLREKGELYRDDDFVIKSSGYPQFYSHSIYLRGDNKEQDRNADYVMFKTEAGAIGYIEKVKHHIAKFNSLHHQALDKTEHQYLEKLINMIPAKVLTIEKQPICRDTKEFEFISIRYENKGCSNAVPLPLFKKGKMYKGIKPNKRHTLVELGLTQNSYIKI